MYNEERKNGFLFQYNGITSENYLNNLFEKCSQIEESMHKDVCDFIKTEIIYLFTAFGTSTVKTLRVYKSYLKQYTDYCCMNNLSKDNINHYDEINDDDLKGCVNYYTAQLKYIPITTMRQWSQQLANPVNVFVLWALFEGIKGDAYKDIFNLKYSDINFSTKTVRCLSGKTIKVSEDFLYWANRASETSDYEYFNGKHRCTYRFVENGYIYKTRTYLDPTQTTEVNANNRMFRIIKEMKRALDAAELSVPHLLYSGIIYHLLYQYEDIETMYQKCIDNEKYVETLREKYNMEQIPNGQFVALLKEYLG